MIEDNRTNVLAALEAVLEEIEAEIELVNRDGARFFEEGEYEEAKRALERAGQIKCISENIETIRNHWIALFPEMTKGDDTDDDAVGPSGVRLPRGVRSPEKLFYFPILDSLRELGGSARNSEVLERVLHQMKDVLQDVDFEPLASTPGMPRWKNTAAWARNTLKERGLMRKDSPHGVWEISDLGRQFLKQGGGG